MVFSCTKLCGTLTTLRLQRREYAFLSRFVQTLDDSCAAKRQIKSHMAKWKTRVSLKGAARERYAKVVWRLWWGCLLQKFGWYDYDSNPGISLGFQKMPRNATVLRWFGIPHEVFSNNLHSRERLPRGQECAEAFHALDDNRKDLVLFGWIKSQISARERSLLNWSICEDSLKGAYVDPSVNLEIGLMRQRLRMKDFSKNSGCSLQTWQSFCVMPLPYWWGPGDRPSPGRASKCAARVSSDTNLDAK